MNPAPLDGVRVVSLAVNIPGPVAAARLRDLGAGVTRVEPPAGDPLARVSAAWHRELTAGQRVLRLDLKASGDRRVLDELLAASDLLLTAMRPAALTRLGLAPAALRAAHPRLCHVAVTGYGAPHQDRAGHDLTYQAAAGVVRPPDPPLTLLADLAAAERVVSAALALLFARERTGSGGHAAVAIAEAAAAFADPLRFGLTSPGGVLGGGLPAYGLYPAADGWVAVAALEAHFLTPMLDELGLATADAASLAAAFRTRTAGEWETWAATRDLPIVAVREPRRASPGSAG